MPDMALVFVLFASVLVLSARFYGLFLTIREGLPSCGRKYPAGSSFPLNKHQPFHVEGEVDHADLYLRPLYPDRAHKQPHPRLLFGENMLDMASDFGARRICPLLLIRQIMAPLPAEVNL